jgi:transcriptional regulator with GAF, ATPase, and Fis domain
VDDRVLEIAKLVLGEMDVDRVLTSGLDGIIDLCGAERGMILLFDPDGSLQFERARNLERQDIENPEFQVSRTVIRRVRSEGKPFFDPDLPAQPLGSYGDSVFRLGLMAVICLPLRFDGNVFGVVYLDSRSRKRSFTADTLGHAATFSDFLSVAAHNALDRRRLTGRVDSLEQALRGKYRFEGIVGSDPKMVAVLKLVAQVAASDATVLIEGESGTGKELIARAIHYNSRRHEKPFVPLNCGALPETLQEAELFGHERGAFTGAIRTNPGWFEQADGGTIFLDEVGEMPPALQVKFLRVLETGEYSRVGSTTIRKADVRIVAASNRSLEELVEQGAMRRDLHYRLAVIRVLLPPLRQRRSDIPGLARHYLDQFREPGDDRQFRLSPEAEALLEAYPFPGNVRELQNLLRRAMLIAESPVIEPRHLPEAVVRAPDRRAPLPSGASFREAKQRVLEDFEHSYIARCLEESEGHITRAAQAAGMDVKNFHTKMTRYGIDPSRFKPRRAGS